MMSDRDQQGDASMGDMPGGTRRERDIEPLANVPRVRVTGPDGTIRAYGHYGIFIDHMPGADGLVRDEWVHHVVLTRGFADWHMPCEPRLYEIREDDVVEIDGEPKPPQSRQRQGRPPCPHTESRGGEPVPARRRRGMEEARRRMARRAQQPMGSGGAMTLCVIFMCRL